MQVPECMTAGTPLPSMAASALLPIVKIYELQSDLADLAGYVQAAIASSSRQTAQLSLPTRISLVKGGVICACYKWSPDHAIIETARATASLYGDEYSTSVAVASSVERQLWYVQLRALSYLATGDDAKHKLALVRWYEEVDGEGSSASPDDHLAVSFGCKRLKWAQQHKRGIRVPHYTVIQLANIVRRPCIVPDCSKRNRMVA